MIFMILSLSVSESGLADENEYRIPKPKAYALTMEKNRVRYSPVNIDDTGFPSPDDGSSCGPYFLMHRNIWRHGECSWEGMMIIKKHDYNPTEVRKVFFDLSCRLYPLIPDDWAVMSLSIRDDSYGIPVQNSFAGYRAWIVHGSYLRRARPYLLHVDEKVGEQLPGDFGAKVRGWADVPSLAEWFNYNDQLSGYTDLVLRRITATIAIIVVLYVAVVCADGLIF